MSFGVFAINYLQYYNYPTVSTIENHKKYLFTFAHPDDEVYSCSLMHRLVKLGNSVSVAYVTSGDSGGNSKQREAELYDSMAAIGIAPVDIHLLRFSENKVLNKLSDITKAMSNVIDKVMPDCVVGMDYEGGHEVHDSASFVTSQSLISSKVSYYVFPVYHAVDDQRQGGLFLFGRGATDVIKLDSDEIEVKIKVLEAHRGQIGHFLHLQLQSPEYFQRLFTREIYREIANPIDYTVRPAKEVGYESHRNGFKFDDFKQAVGVVIK